MYNSKYGIMFKVNPLMQCILGQFEGWQLVLESFIQTRPIQEGDEILFSYNSHSQFNKLVKHIQKMNNSQTA